MLSRLIRVGAKPWKVVVILLAAQSGVEAGVRGAAARAPRGSGARRRPSPDRQVHASTKGSAYRDVEYEPYLLNVELDGRPGHTSTADRDDDLERDLDAAVALDRLTVRLGWGQVFERPCVTADKVAKLLSRRGWTGELTRCPACSPEQAGGSLASDETDPRLSA